jgi:hypothetical protein
MAANMDSLPELDEAIARLSEIERADLTFEVPRSTLPRRQTRGAKRAEPDRRNGGYARIRSQSAAVLLVRVIPSIARYFRIRRM